MTTWTDTTKSATPTWNGGSRASASWTGVSKSDTGVSNTINQGIKFMPFIMQYAEDIVLSAGASVWTSPTKN